MATTNVRCPRCGYTPMGPSASTLRAGRACPQCSAPLALGEPPTHASPKGAAHPMGREDRAQARTESARRPAKVSGPLGKIISLAVWIAILSAVTGQSPARLVRFVQDRIAAVRRGEPVVPRNAPGGPDGFTAPADFELIVGTWIGSTTDEAGQDWTFAFSPPDRARIIEADGTLWNGRARVYWERGAADGLRVLPGGYPLDLALERRGAKSPAVLLGTYRLQGSDSMQLCVVRPDALERTSEFRTTETITCWSLVRTGKAP